MGQVFNSREIAIGVWVAVIFLVVCSTKVGRHGIWNIAAACCNRHILGIYALMAGYVYIVVKALNEFGLWNSGQLKNTVLWFMLVASVELFKADSLGPGDHYFRKSIKRHISLLVLVQFIVSLRTFGLVTELIVVPLSTLAVGMLAFSETKKEYRPVERFLSPLLSIFGLFLVCSGLYYVATNFEKIAQSKTLLDLFVPIALSLFLLPFVYLVSLYIRYQSTLVRIHIYTDNPVNRLYAKVKGLIHFLGDHKGLNSWVSYSCMSDFESWKSIDNSIRNFKP